MKKNARVTDLDGFAPLDEGGRVRVVPHVRDLCCHGRPVLEPPHAASAPDIAALARRSRQQTWVVFDVSSSGT
eukprot:3746224-Rhodomonas_salina.2